MVKYRKISNEISTIKWFIDIHNTSLFNTNYIHYQTYFTQSL